MACAAFGAYPAEGQGVQPVSSTPRPRRGGAEPAERPGGAARRIGAQFASISPGDMLVEVPGGIVGAHMLQAEPEISRSADGIWARGTRPGWRSSAYRSTGPPGRPGRARRPGLEGARRLMVPLWAAWLVLGNCRLRVLEDWSSCRKYSRAPQGWKRLSTVRSSR